MEQNDSDVRDIFKCRENLLKQMSYLGYNTETYDSFDINDVNTMLSKDQLDMLLTNDETEKKVYVKFHPGKSLRQNVIEELIDDLFNIEKMLTEKDSVIIIIKELPNDTINGILNYIWSNQKIFITVRSIKTLQFNIFEHSYVPPHTILNESEVNEFKRQYNIIRNDMIPEISRFEPVALALLMKPGEICKIKRSSKTAVQSDFYRICV